MTEIRPNQRRPLWDRLIDKVVVSDQTDCWLWTGGTSKGYARILDDGPSNARRMIQAHRVVYELLIGPIPVDRELDHLCRNRGCMNPWHLEPVTTRENLLRGTGASARNALKTHCVNGHEFTAENTHITPDGWRSCRACVRDRKRASYYANHADELEKRRLRRLTLRTAQ